MKRLDFIKIRSVSLNYLSQYGVTQGNCISLLLQLLEVTVLLCVHICVQKGPLITSSGIIVILILICLESHFYLNVP